MVGTYHPYHPSAEVEVSVVSGEANVLGEVGKGVFALGQPGVPFDWDFDDRLGLVCLLEETGTEKLSLFDHPRIEVLLGEDLVQCRKNHDILGLASLKDC